MIIFLHTFQPSPILSSIGPVNIYWYGFFVCLAVLSSLMAAVILIRKTDIKPEAIIDLTVWLVVGGLIGARLYDAGLEYAYFANHPLDILKIWQGGLAIHGALIGGCLALWLYAKKYGHNFWRLAALTATVLPLGQAIGRWGNYFNQELFGYPTALPWGIPIDFLHRPWLYLDYTYFHPTFLYESLGNLLIFIILVFCQIRIIKKNKTDKSVYQLLLAVYFSLYSLLRFFLEFVRVDNTPAIFNLRFPQIISLAIILACLSYFAGYFWLKTIKKTSLEK